MGVWLRTYPLLFICAVMMVFLASASVWAAVPRLEQLDRLSTGFSPSPGAELRENAPSFTWPSRANADLYRLRLARTAAEVAQAAPVESKLNVFTPAEPLAAGVWYWQVEALRSGSVLAASEVMSFSVPEVEHPFTLPDMATIRSTIRPHPRIFVDPEILQSFRQDSKNALLRQAVDTQVAPSFYNTVMEPEPTWVAAGTPTGEEFKLYVQPLINGPSLRMTAQMQDLGWAYMLTGNKDYANAAKRIALHLAAWDPNGSTSYRNADQAFRDIAVKLAIVYDWLYPVLDEKERATIAQAIAARAQVLFDDLAPRLHKNPHDSHGQTAIGYLGVIALALVGDDPAATEWLDYIVPVYTALFPPWGGSDGGWGQGIGYQQWSIDYGSYFWLALKSATGIDYFRRPWYQNAGNFKIYFQPPYTDRSYFGDDNTQKPNKLDAFNMAMLAAETGNGYYKWYAQQLGVSLPLLDPRTLLWMADYRQVATQDPADLPPAVYFSDIGWVAMHSQLGDPDAISLYFKSSPYGSFNHSHADQNSFVLYAFGQALAIDSGAYDYYGSPHDMAWTRQTKAHNAVLVGGNGQAIWDITATGSITAFHHSASLDFTRGDATPAYKGQAAQAVRSIAYRRPGYFAVADTLRSVQPTTYQWLLHAVSPMDIDSELNRVVVSQEDVHLDAQFVVPAALEFSQNDEFGVEPITPYPKEWHLTAATTTPQTEQRFLTVLTPYQGERPQYQAMAIPCANGQGLKVETPDGQDHFFFRDTRGDISYGPFSAYGEFAMYSERSDGLTDWSLVGGTDLAVANYTVHVQAPVSVSWQAQADGGVLTIDASETVAVELTLPFTAATETPGWTVNGATLNGTVEKGHTVIEVTSI